ncbi:hypothetical protein L6R53_19485 [Myxococcota bacterium]|nr:hypothetical protein [Myxococcota bacterium]
MAVAFGTFEEPHAWLIRGLVEYGWPDLSPVAGRIPPGRPGGFELVRFRDSGGKDGVHLLVVAASGPQLVQEDGVYDFALRCYRRDGRWMVGLRCVEANFLQEFPFDPANPGWAAGYVHQAIVGYVPQFVTWRLQGGELTWAQRKGLPELEGEPCSAGLARFVDELVRTRRGVDTGPLEGWWLGRDSAPPPAGHAPSPAAAGAPGGGLAPVGAGPIAVAGKAAGSGVSTTERALAKARPAGRALVGSSSLLLMVGLVSLLNALLTVLLFALDRPAALGGSGCFGLALVLAGGLGIAGGRKLSQLKGGVLPWLAVGANLAMPPLLGGLMLTIDLLCCAASGPLMVCLPIALYALSVQVDPTVSKARRDLAGR